MQCTAARRALEAARLIVDLTEQRILAGGEVVRMSPAELAFYALCEGSPRRRQRGARPQQR